MNETMVCVVGNVATQPVYRDTAAGASARFRLAVTSRYWDRERSAWTDGHTNFFTVWARRQLATNAAASLAVGDPVVVQGRLKVRVENRDRQSRTSADVEAVAVGHDLARGTSAFRRVNRPEAGGAAVGPPEGGGPGTGVGAGGGGGGGGGGAGPESRTGAGQVPDAEPVWETPVPDGDRRPEWEPAVLA
ncbi:single-stranded DNA-binding protein [Streptomyces sp. NPDC008150]|uniref:single-stranded DNA-binding protein n=1 Tax=Streptomyces sp. NPDC008150 TaxID=3364816 RepID=UPI0036E2F56B